MGGGILEGARPRQTRVPGKGQITGTAVAQPVAPKALGMELRGAPQPRAWAAGCRDREGRVPPLQSSVTREKQV